jgi:uncharacterized protein (TIGR02453 family)
VSSFDGRTLGFLRDLKRHNRRPWFEENRDRYLRDLREPAQRFILDMGQRLDEVSPHLVADPRPVGGSLFRIHRDLRFSKDKSPYKTFLGIQFRHAAGKDAHAPGLYLHVEPGASFVGMGVWHPASAPLRAIREAIATDGRSWQRAVNGEAFRTRLQLGGDSLTRAPRGFDADHPLAEDLRRKDFVASAPLSDREVLADDLLETVVEVGRAGRPFLAFLCRALDVRF